MTSFKGKYRNQTVRLRTWDYAASAYYYVTICTRERAHFFGQVVDGEMVLSKIGQMAQQYWAEIPQHFSHADVDAFVIMPNHMHGIVIIQRGLVGPRHGAAQHGAAGHGAASDGGETGEDAHDGLDACDATGPRHGAALPPSSPTAPTDGANAFGPLKPGSLQSIVNQYKGAVTRWCRTNDHAEFAWQARYYEHIIRTESALTRIRDYIINNPSKWGLDRANQPGPWM
jgi:REP element-mobilizing transposase RayT